MKTMTRIVTITVLMDVGVMTPSIVEVDVCPSCKHAADKDWDKHECDYPHSCTCQHKKYGSWKGVK